MPIKTVTQPKFNVDTEAEKATLINMADGIEVYVKSTGRSYTLQAGVFVSSGKISKNYTSSEAETLNATTTFVTKLISTFNVPENVEYQMMWSYAITNDAANKMVETTMLLDGIEVGSAVEYFPAVGMYKSVCSFYNSILNVGNHTFEIKFRLQATGQGSQARMKRARLDISKT